MIALPCSGQMTPQNVVLFALELFLILLNINFSYTAILVKHKSPWLKRSYLCQNFKKNYRIQDRPSLIKDGIFLNTYNLIWGKYHHYVLVQFEVLTHFCDGFLSKNVPAFRTIKVCGKHKNLFNARKMIL